jgi:hypothetical protein
MTSFWRPRAPTTRCIATGRIKRLREVRPAILPDARSGMV